MDQIGRPVERERAAHAVDARADQLIPSVAVPPDRMVTKPGDVQPLRRLAYDRIGRVFGPPDQIVRARGDTRA